MHGDFSLNPLHYRDRVSRVLYQMGRVQLDSDANEQTESTLRFLRGLATDVIGYHGGQDGGFRLFPDKDDPKKLRVGWGVYYVDGIRCVNMPAGDFWQLIGSEEARKKAGDGRLLTEHSDSYWDQEAYESLPSTPATGGDGAAGHLLYLAVWERHISAAEYDELREVALLGPDTTSRAVVVWQIRMTPAKPILDLAKELEGSLGLSPTDPDSLKLDPVYLALNLSLRSSARLKAYAAENTDMDACAISPEARYRGTENRLYRVEIHDSGATPTFKWSPDNASIVYPIRDIAGPTVSLESLGRDDRTAIMKNDWVELVDDTIALKKQINPLLKVIDVDRHHMTVTLDGDPKKTPGTLGHPILRRWASDVLPLKEGSRIELSDGVEVQFSKADIPKGGYRSGDYWLIPSRTATGDVLWPGGRDKPHAVAPHGIDEHYAPLALYKSSERDANKAFTDKRWRFQPLATAIP